jgi:predicted dehydrogenase
MKKIKGGNDPRGSDGRRHGGGGLFVEGGGHHTHTAHHAGYSDAHGKETVANWICVEGCPVAALDEQSGERKTTWISPTHKNNRDGDFMGALNHPGHQGYNDTGGASRFYKQVGGNGEAP